VDLSFSGGGRRSTTCSITQPRLKAEEGKKAEYSLRRARVTVVSRNSMSLGPMSPFRPAREVRHGDGPDLLPGLATIADDICLLRGRRRTIARTTGTLQLHTGAPSRWRTVDGRLGEPTVWGTENQNLPSFITIIPPARSSRRGVSPNNSSGRGSR